MFKSMRMNLKNKLNDSEEVNKIRWKINKFLELNPDVDHYMCDETNRKITVGVLLGFLIGFGFAMFVFFLMAYLQLDIWHAQGYLKLPGSFLWG